jgi:hypothetical protein
MNGSKKPTKKVRELCKKYKIRVTKDLKNGKRVYKTNLELTKQINKKNNNFGASICPSTILMDMASGSLSRSINSDKVEVPPNDIHHPPVKGG